MNLKSINQFSRDYEIPAEDVLLIDFNRKGLSTTLKYERVRFYFTLIDHPSFQTSKELGIKNFFFGVPTKSGVNDYTLEEGSVFLGSEKIGDVEYIADDTCDSTYSRKDGKVLVLNSRSKGSCVGCDFCHTFQQTPNDDLYFEDDELIPYSIDRWLEGNERDDLSHLEQISILTGCFGSEDEVLDHIDLVRRIAPTYGFNNEILYYGSELRSENALKKLADLGPIEFCLSLECFDYRKKILAPQKRDLTLSDAKKILELSNSLGMNTRFSYILGLEPLDTLAQHMQEFLPLINHIPVINIFQPHTLEKRDLITPEAEKLEYFLDGRKILEKLFIPANLKPNTWENYRSPWFLSFGNDFLVGDRMPSTNDEIARKLL